MKREDIQRLKKQQLYKIQLSDIEIKTFADEKKPKMPALLGKSGALPFKVLYHEIIIQRRASQENFLFPYSGWGGWGGDEGGWGGWGG